MLKMFLATAVLALFCFSNKCTAVLDYSGRSIVDDEVASALKNPCPLSVSSFIADVKQKKGYEEEKTLDLSFNNLTVGGAVSVMKFILEELPNLEKLDLSYNGIYEEDNDAVSNFNGALVHLLDKQHFKSIDLSGNGIANISWIRALSYLVDERRLQKIKWMVIKWMEK